MRRWAALVIIWGLGAVSGSMVGWTSALFTSTTSNPGNNFTAASSFCPTPSTQTAATDRDSYIREDQVGNNFGGDATLNVQSRSGQDRRTLIYFPLPSKPGGCVVSSAILRLYATTAAAGRTIEAHRLGATWTETGVNWTNQPATDGNPPTTSSSGTAPAWKEWNVTSQVDLMYSASNNGFLLKDQSENAGSSLLQVYQSEEGTTNTQDPQLVITFSDQVCSSPGSQTLTATQDAWVQEDSAGNDNHGTDTLLDVQSDTTRDRRALVGFPSLPSVPASCTLISATLRLFGATIQGTRSLEAYRADASWSELGVVWNNQPATTGGAATTPNGTGWREWNAQTQVQAMYDTGTNNGFIIKDSVESSTGFKNDFHSRENTNVPELVVTFG